MLRLLGQRFAYANTVIPCKTGPTSGIDPARVQTLIAQRRRWAIDIGLNPDVIEQLYRDVMPAWSPEADQPWAVHPQD